MNKVSKAAHVISETVVAVILSAIGIISAIPELIGTLEATDNAWFAFPVAAMGVGAVHVAIITGARWLWYVFGIHLLVLEITLIIHGAYAEMTYPIFTAIGAVVMVQFMEYNKRQEKEREEQAKDRELMIDDKEFEREQKRQDRELTRQLRAERERAKIEQGTVPQTVTSGVHVHPPASGEQGVHDTVDRQSMLQSMLQSVDTPDEINKSKIARELGVSRATVIRDLKSLEKSGAISLNGSVKVNTNGVSK